MILLFIILLAAFSANGQIFLHGTTGIQGERVTNCLVSTCSGSYFDNGGNAGNYANNVAGGLYRVFCPSMIGGCVRVTFNSFRTESGFDYLTIGNGATQNSPVFTTPPANNVTGRITGVLAVPFTYTANNPSGCLTFRFTSDATINDAGWSASLSCVPCATPGFGPNGIDPNDCTRAIPVCGNSNITGNATSPGLLAEGCPSNSCPAGGENHTQWYLLTVQSSGTLNWLIDPTINTDDYDFAVYGPNVTCGNLGNPVRCSDSGNTGNTGSDAVSIDNIENVTGNSFVAQMNVIAGQTYYMVVDEWSANSGGGYTLSWGGTASLSCSPILPIKLLHFGAQYRENSRDAYLSWATASEYLNPGFTVERSYDGINFDSIGWVETKGNGTTRQDYEFIDGYPSSNGYTYYRLKWVDNNRDSYSDIAAIAVDNPIEYGILVFPNPTNSKITIRNFYTGTASLEVYDILGRIVISKEIFNNSNDEIVSLENYPAGSYIFKIEGRTFSKEYLIIKK
jgi:hypothetical protein